MSGSSAHAELKVFFLRAKALFPLKYAQQARHHVHRCVGLQQSTRQALGSKICA
jgi:hypothetical protein